MKNRKLCCKKFDSMVWATSFSISMATLLSMSDRILAGLMLGPEAISAINLVCPAYMFGTFVAGMISIGAAFIFSRALGEFDKEKADSVFGLSVTYSTILGILLGIAMLVFRRQYFDYLGVSEEIEEIALKYYYWIVLVNVLYPIRMVLSEFVTNEGDELLTSLSYFAQLIGNFLLSIILCRLIGIAGIALGTVAGTVIAIAINGCHFFRKGNNLHYRFCVNFRLLCDVLKGSLADSILYLLMAVTDYFLNYLVVAKYTEESLPILSVATVIIHLTIIFDGIGTGFAPLINVYQGEKNYKVCENLMDHVIKVAIAEGIVTMLIFFFGAPLIVKLFGELSPFIYSESVIAVRIISLLMPGAAVLINVISLYNICGHEYATSIIECFEQTIMVVLFTYLFSAFFGMRGLWIGYVVAVYIVIAACILILPRVWGKEKFPWFLPDTGIFMETFDVVISPENIVELNEKITNILEQKDVGMKTSIRMQLIIEELGMSIFDKNGKKEILSEWTISVDNDVRLVIRYEGKAIDFTGETEEDASIRSMVLSNLMAQQEKKQFLMSTGFNRCALMFGKD